MAPNVAFPHILFLSFLLFPLFAVPQSNVTLGTFLTAGEGSQWTSPSGDFAFGFQGLEDDSFLLCIWYNNIPVPDQTIVWSANGDNPAPRNSRIELTTAGQLVLTNPQGQELWETQISSSNVAYGAMLDNGNFVLESNDFYHVWESFSQPTGTILPGQTLQVGGKLYCRLTDTNYTRGRFELQLLAGKLQLNPVAMPTYSAYDPYFTIQANLDDPFSQLVFNESGYLYLQRTDGTVYYLFQTPFADYYYRATLDIHGAFFVYKHPRPTLGTSEGWTIDVSFPDNICEAEVDLGSGPCGYNSYCEFANGAVNCSCPPEYVPIDQNSTISGCKPKIPLVCEEDQSPEDLYEFLELGDTDWPLDDYEKFHPIGEEDCKTSCLYDCYCAVVIYGLNETCWKKKLPLSNGRSSSTVARIALFKLRQPSKSTTNRTSDSTTNTSSNSTMKNKDKKVAILAASLGASVSTNFLLLAATCLTAFFGYRRRPKSKQGSNLSETNLRSFTYEELEESTNGFKEELGKGSFGIVYKGLYPPGSKNLVAVKRLGKVVQEVEKEFKTEVSVIGQTHHKNLVRLFGFCDEGPHRLLVYEFMSNGSLASFLFELSRPNWDQRAHIAVGIARGLAYLHEECSTQIIHCDIKPQNILLDDNFRPRISDFGLAKLLMPDQDKTRTCIRGTKGYVAPEWFRSMPITAKVDVYSFGVMLLEIVSCRRSVETAWTAEEKAILTDWAYDCYREGRLEELVERDEEPMRDEKRLLTFVMIAIWCVQEDPSLRPTMKQVSHMLEGVVHVPSPPSPHPFSSYSESYVTDA